MPRPNKEVRCDNCQAWTRERTDSDAGECRFNAPTDAGREKGFPRTRQDAWCMQWRPISTQLPLVPELPVQQVARGRKVDLSD